MVALLSVFNFAHFKGLYLLSTAGEDVLLISQITSGRRQFVPRLGGRVTGIGQTTSGSLYSLSLANNIVKIINAGDLEVISEISGIQPISPLSLEQSCTGLPVASLQPSQQHVYLSAGNDSMGTFQGYDVWLDQQAVRLEVGTITRTKTVGKDQREVFPPKVTYSTFTSDGSWLVTMDEWDDHYTLGQGSARETNLKFWAWNGRQWEIMTKIEDPHGIRCRVLGLTSPGRQASVKECATLGENGSVKVWRLLNAPPGSSALSVWSLHKTIGSYASNKSDKEGALVYSTDGSVLIAAVGIDLLVIDSSSGHIARCIHLGQPTSSLSTLGSQVLCLHPEIPMLSGWDIRTGQATFSERLNGRSSILAVNHSRSTFAFSTSDSSASRSSITISEVIGKEKSDLARISLDSFAAVLLGAEFPDFSGYIAIDQSGQIRCIAPEPSKSLSTIKTATHQMSTLIPQSVSKEFDVSGVEMSGQKKGIQAQELRNILGMKETIDLAGIYESIVQKLV
jgi:NET1-associated nuclear protein 1 (U3 small nucleolar RNA-associated protein 17)